MISRIILTLIAVSFLLVSGTSLGAQGKSKGGTAEPDVTSDFVAFSTSGGGGGRAGMVLDVKSNIGGVGASSTLIDASWDWGLYSALHPCALMDSMESPPLYDFLSQDLIMYQATVTITANNGDKIVGQITGGSVCELSVSGPLMSVNEWLIGFIFDGSLSTGRFADRSGSGYINMRIDSGVGDFSGPFQISLNLSN